MGTKSARGMGTAQSIPGHKHFEGSPNRFNAQGHIRTIITAAKLPENVHRTLSAEIRSLWTRNTAPLAVIGFVETFLDTYHEKHTRTD